VQWQDLYLARYYRGVEGWVDGTTEFHRLCAEHIPPGARILEIGAGPTNKTSQFLAGLGELHGVDLNESVKTNEALLTAAVIVEDRYPFDAADFDACVSNYVMEHVENPKRHLREIQRVLKPGGVFVFRTPNTWHYTALVSRRTPHSFHERLANRLRNLPDGSPDPCRTYYRLNSRRKLRAACAACGFELASLTMVEKEPSYGLSSRALFMMFLAWERLVNSRESLAGLRSNIFGVARKRPTADPDLAGSKKAGGRGSSPGMA
jgi:SAM-dependent methyltransferase